MILLCDCFGISIRSPWWFLGISTGFHKHGYGIPVGFLLDFHEISMEFLWNSHGISVVFLRDFFGSPIAIP